MSSIGELTFFLGLQVKQKEDGIFISQDKYVNEILNKFGFSDVKTARTPMETQKALLKDADGEDVDEHLYRLMIASLIYLKGQPKLGLWYPKDSPFDLVAYTDSDYAGASLDRKSTTGGCQFLGCRLISWQCKKQTVVANSTTEAEYIAASNCCGQVLWIQNQLLDYGYNFMQTKIHIDNESTICIVKNPVFHSKTKHIEIRHHFIRDSNEKKLIQMIKIHTDQNVADLLTKAFDVSRFEYLIASITYYCWAIAGSVNAIRLNLVLLVQVNAVEGSDLQLEDAEGTECLPNATVFELLTLMSVKTTTWNEFSSTMASAVIYLATNQKFNFSKYILDNMVKNLEGGVKFLMYPRWKKTKNQISFDEQEAIRLQAEFGEEVRLAKEKDEANVALIEEWNDIQAKIDADYQMAKQMQAEEQEELSIKEKSKLPHAIVDWKILKEGKVSYYQIIRADGSSKRPEEGYERVLWGDLKTMFKHHVEDTMLEGIYKENKKKRYPLTPATITEMLNKKLQADHWNEMCYQLLKLITKQLKNQ
ncbi:putative ribonuclease H-like domain-containing protein [Tanacetum coccineum]